MKRLWKIVLPILVIAVAAAVAFAMYSSREAPEVRIPDPPVPLVRVQTVVAQNLPMRVRSQGTVRPRTESTLVPEVSGRIIAVSPSFESGGFFEAGDVLLELDSRDYEQALILARADVTQAELLLATEQAAAEVAKREWEEIGDGVGLPLTLHEPQVADARARVEAARSGLEKAERNLERTRIEAPYAGRVRMKQVDVGQFVSPGTPLATIYAIDYAEIRLPLPDEDLAFLDLPLSYRGDRDGRAGPEVVLTADFAGRRNEWRGRIVRTEGEIDSRSRMVHAVARVKDPYGRSGDPDRAPLAVGLFVEAEIVGHTLAGVMVLPREAVRGENQVLVVDDDSRIRFRDLEILRRTRSEVFVGSGLADGEAVCLSTLATVTDGMRVRVLDGGDEPPAPERTGS